MHSVLLSPLKFIIQLANFTTHLSRLRGRQKKQQYINKRDLAFLISAFISFKFLIQLL